MPDIHTIRLRHPWQCEPCAAGARWVRPFNWPAGLTPREIVWLVIDPVPMAATVLLSGKPLVAEVNGRFEITRLLIEFNTLAIEIPEDFSPEKTACPFDVRLEIVEG